MAKNRYYTYHPEILGMTWTPGNLVLVGSRPAGGKFQYALGNGVVLGTKDEIPVALFKVHGDRQKIMRMLIRMQVGDEIYDNGQYSAKDYKDFPIFIENTSHLTIAYLVERIFHMVEEHGVQMVIVDCLQDVDGSLLDDSSKERELNAVLRILKALAEAMSIVIVVTSKLSDHVFKGGNQPTIRDILDVSEAEEHCDQIILIHPLVEFFGKYKLILPLGHPYYDGQYENLVLNVTMDRDKHYFMKATEPFDEADSSSEETPMYQWYPGQFEGEWCFEFIDAEGMGWTITLEPMVEDENHYYQINVQNWASEEELLDDYVDLDDIELIKAVALEKARKRFPEVEIPDNS